MVPAKVISEGRDVFLLKRCPDHGVQKTLVSSDIDYWKLCREFRKPGDLPLEFQTAIDRGCPHDCGLCPDHEQHSCLALIEVNDACNLRCPICFADSGPGHGTHLDLARVEAMLDRLVASEGNPDLVQISGGEPTLHPHILDILGAAKRRPIRHLMLNTNGVRLANDPDFVAALADLQPGFEVYLQFDSLRPGALRALRGADLTDSRRRALDKLDAAGVSTTLVAVVAKGINDDEVGDLIRLGLAYDCVRGVTFQPIQAVGRLDGLAQRDDRMVLSEIRQAVIDQSGLFGAEDLIPLPCNPDMISIGYGLRGADGLVPLTGLLPRELLLQEAPNAIAFEKFPDFRDKLFELLSLSAVGSAGAGVLHDVLCCLPKVETPAQLTYADIFRVAIVQFMDRFNFCLAGVKRSCIHFVVPDGRIIPFDTYNLFHREATAPRHVATAHGD